MNPCTRVHFFVSNSVVSVRNYHLWLEYRRLLGSHCRIGHYYGNVTRLELVSSGTVKADDTRTALTLYYICDNVRKRGKPE